MRPRHADAGLHRGLGLLLPALMFLAMLPVGPSAAADVEILRVGVPAEYRIEGTPGTGAEWTFTAAASSHAELVEVEALGYGDPLNDLIGGPAPYIFRLTPLAPGYAQLVFSYQRSWESEPFETHVLWVFIQDRTP